jgi:pyruvate/2-oxoglutarate dehydrogenase complex dihydrolipoamide dehydrogenase (E3) component
MYDVVIIGAGAAGLGCGITLASANNKFDWAKDKKYLILDDGKSDLKKASLFNVPGFDYGISGQNALKQMRDHLSFFPSIEIKDEKVIMIEGNRGNFSIKTSESEYKADIIVLATGMNEFNIEGLDVTVADHDKVMKPNKIRLEHIDNRITDGIYVAGLLSGVKTMFLIASGDGSKVACDIFEEWTGKKAVSHDSVKDAIC